MEQDTRRAGVPSASIGVGSLAGTGFWKSANDGATYYTEVVIIHTIRVSTHSRNTAYLVYMECHTGKHADFISGKHSVIA